MNTYLVPINEGDGPYIKKILARSEKAASDKLYDYFFNKYEDVDGDTLDEIKDQLWDAGVDIGDIYDIDEFA